MASKGLVVGTSSCVVIAVFLLLNTESILALELRGIWTCDFWAILKSKSTLASFTFHSSLGADVDGLAITKLLHTREIWALNRLLSWASLHDVTMHPSLCTSSIGTQKRFISWTLSMLRAIQRVNLTGVVVALVWGVLWAGDGGSALVEDAGSIWATFEVVGALGGDALVDCGLAGAVVAFDGARDGADTDGWAFGFEGSA